MLIADDDEVATERGATEADCTSNILEYPRPSRPARANDGCDAARRRSSPNDIAVYRPLLQMRSKTLVAPYLDAAASGVFLPP
jgi:hypothetical protein